MPSQPWFITGNFKARLTPKQGKCQEERETLNDGVCVSVRGGVSVYECRSDYVSMWSGVCENKDRKVCECGLVCVSVWV